MADKSLASDRSRSPAGSKGDGNKGDVCELDEKFLVLWAKHVEPKMVEKSKEFEAEIKNVVGSFVKSEVDRLQEKVDIRFTEVEKKS